MCIFLLSFLLSKNKKDNKTMHSNNEIERSNKNKTTIITEDELKICKMCYSNDVLMNIQCKHTLCSKCNDDINTYNKDKKCIFCYNARNLSEMYKL